MTQRREPIRSRKLLDSAKGQPCDLNFIVCNHDPETTVSCHIHDESFGAGRKADDTSTIHGCLNCHMFLDHGWVGKMEWATVQQHIIRGLQRTLRNRIDRGLIVIPRDAERLSSERPIAARKPRDQRAKIVSAPMPKNSRPIPQPIDPWGKSRKVANRSSANE